VYQLKIKRSAQKEIDSIPEHYQDNIISSILSLKNDPSPFPQSKKLKGEEDKRRLTVGDYRVVYSIDERQKIVSIFRVRHRKDVYR
jgi:mRNA interferase RelE/StbE